MNALGNLRPKYDSGADRSACMNYSLSPRDGDVVITRASHSHPTYQVQIVPGPQQISVSKKEAAIAQARRWPSGLRLTRGTATGKR